MYGLQKLLVQALSLALPAIIVFCCFYPYRQRALQAMQLKSTLQREVGLIVFLISIFGILAITLWPSYSWTDTNGMWGNLLLLIDRPNLGYSVNLIPFNFMIDLVEKVGSGNPMMVISGIVNMVGNLVIFVPIGFFPALLFRKATLRRSLIVGLSMALLIEGSQYFIVRTVDIDDVIINTVGAICGYALYIMMRRICPAGCRKFSCSELNT